MKENNFSFYGNLCNQVICKICTCLFIFVTASKFNQIIVSFNILARSNNSIFFFSGSACIVRASEIVATPYPYQFKISSGVVSHMHSSSHYCHSLHFRTHQPLNFYTWHLCESIYASFSAIDMNHFTVWSDGEWYRMKGWVYPELQLCVTLLYKSEGSAVSVVIAL